MTTKAGNKPDLALISHMIGRELSNFKWFSLNLKFRQLLC